MTTNNQHTPANVEPKRGGPVVRITENMIRGCPWRHPYQLLAEGAIRAALDGETSDRSPETWQKYIGGWAAEDYDIRVDYCAAHKGWIATVMRGKRRPRIYTLPEAVCEWLELRRLGKLPIKPIDFRLPEPDLTPEVRDDA